MSVSPLRFSSPAASEMVEPICLLNGAGWIGFEVTTPQRLAQRLAQTGLEGAGLDLLDSFEHQAVLDRALDSALAAEEGGLGELSEGIGFRERVHGAVNALRLAGVGPRDLDESRRGMRAPATRSAATAA